MFQLQQHVVWTTIHIAHAIFTFLGFTTWTANYLDENTEYADKDRWTLTPGLLDGKEEASDNDPRRAVLHTQYVMYTFFDAAEEDYYKLRAKRMRICYHVSKGFQNTKTHYS